MNEEEHCSSSNERARPKDDPLADLLEFLTCTRILIRQEFESSKDLLSSKARRAAFTIVFAYVALLVFKAVVFAAVVAVVLGISLLIADLLVLSSAAGLALSGSTTIVLIFLILLLVRSRMDRGFRRRLEQKYHARGASPDTEARSTS